MSVVALLGFSIDGLPLSRNDLPNNVVQSRRQVCRACFTSDKLTFVAQEFLYMIQYRLTSATILAS